MDVTGASRVLSTLAVVRNPPVVTPEQARSNRDLIRAIKAVNQLGPFGNNEITFQIDHNSRRPVIQIVDRITREIVEQIPAEYVLQLADSLGKK